MVKPKRMLCIVGSMNAGGAETFLMKIYRELDKKRYQMDFYVATQEAGFYDKEIMELGGKIHRSLPKTENPIKSFLYLRRTVKREKYKSVMRVSQHSLSSIDLIAAKFGGAKNLIFRSSNSQTGGAKLNQYLHEKFSFLSKRIPNIKIAPSTEAADFMFGKNSVTTGKALIFKNGIALENYTFNNEKRKNKRKELMIENNFVIGHIGRLSFQKNHLFLIDVFSEVLLLEPNSKLLLIGKGELENKIKTKISEMGLTDKVIFGGIRSDVPDILMAMDAFVFPSLFEGMPNTVIEAQASSLNCYISKEITKEANITDLVKYLSIEESPKYWAKEILKHNDSTIRKPLNTSIRNAGYDIRSVVKEFEKLYY